MKDAEHFREKAERCFRLASQITNEHIAEQLRALGRRYSVTAQRLEERARQREPSPDT